jgi:predicted small lipoprotein YifL
MSGAFSNRRVRRSLLLVLCCLPLLGCGQRGPLYLPDEPPADASEADA